MTQKCKEDSILKKEYLKLEEHAIDGVDKASILYNIISIKIDFPEFSKYGKPIYVETKDFIKYTFSAMYERDFEYDRPNLKAIFSLLERMEVRGAIRLMNYLIMMLRRESLNDYLDDCFEFQNSLYLKNFKSAGGTFSWLGFTFFYLTCSLQRILIAICVVLFFYLVILYPVEKPVFLLFSIKYDSYSNVSILNHVLNVIASFFKLTEKHKILPLNELGVLVLIFFKLLFISISAGFVFNQLVNKLNKAIRNV